MPPPWPSAPWPRPWGPVDEAPWLRPEAIAVAGLLLTSHRRCYGRPLIAAAGPPWPDGEWADRARLLAQELFAAPQAVLAHDGGHDPRLIYANRTALALWRRPWAAMVGMPSRLTAEPAERSGRERLLATARRQEAIEGYTGIRVDATGGRFVIDRARLWTLRDAEGIARGQAAAFASWWRL